MANDSSDATTAARIIAALAPHDLMEPRNAIAYVAGHLAVQRYAERAKAVAWLRAQGTPEAQRFADALEAGEHHAHRALSLPGGPYRT